jgi:hypothetical protein
MPSQAEHDDIAKFNSFASSESVILIQPHDDQPKSKSHGKSYSSSP